MHASAVLQGLALALASVPAVSALKLVGWTDPDGQPWDVQTIREDDGNDVGKQLAKPQYGNGGSYKSVRVTDLPKDRKITLKDQWGRTIEILRHNDNDQVMGVYGLFELEVEST